jgi:hypothetical protein
LDAIFRSQNLPRLLFFSKCAITNKQHQVQGRVSGQGNKLHTHWVKVKIDVERTKSKKAEGDTDGIVHSVFSTRRMVVWDETMYLYAW